MYPKEVTQLLNKHHLKVITPFRVADGGFKRSYVLLCQDPKKDTYVLKIFASKDINSEGKFIREVKVLLKLRETKEMQKFTPRIYTYNLDKTNGPLYYILEYFDYRSFGEFTKDLGYPAGIFKKDTFEKFMEFWHLVNTSCQEHLDWLHPYGLSRFTDELNFYQTHTPDVLRLGVWEKVKKYLKNRESLINDCVSLSHLDLYPENLFVEKPFSSNFKIIDWEQSHLTAYGCNEAFMYLMLWREDYFRKKIFARVWERGHVSTFKCFLLLFSVRFLYQIRSFTEAENPNRKSLENFLFSIINDILIGKFDRPKNLQYLLGKNLIKGLLKNYYSLKGEIVCEDFPAGYGNTMIKIKAMTKGDESKDSVFRVYSLSRKAENIRREAKIYRFLSKKGFPTYFIYKNKERRLVSKAAIYNKERFFILTSFLEGATLSRTKLKKSHIIQAGEWLAKMHAAGVIHNDYNRRNVLYDKDIISGIIDMEFSRFTKKHSDHLRDLAKAIALWLQGIDEVALITIFEVYASFMEGYFGKNWQGESSKINKLIVEELRKLRTEYQKMDKISPSDYFKGIIHFINKLLSYFKGNPLDLYVKGVL